MQKSCTPETNLRQWIIKGGERITFLIPSGDLENWEIPPSTREWPLHALEQTKICGFCFCGFLSPVWLFFNSCFSVVFLATFSNTDFDHSSIYSLYFSLHPGNPCSVKFIVAPLQWRKLKMTSCIRDSPSVSCLSLSPSCSLLSIPYIHSGLPLPVFSTATSSGFMFLPFTLDFFFFQLPPQASGGQGFSKAVSSFSLFGFAVRWNAWECWLSTAEQGLRCPSF